MATSCFLNACCFESFDYPVAQISRAEALAVSTQKQRLFGNFENKFWASLQKVFIKPIQGCLTDGNEAIFAPLPFPDVKRSLACIQIAQIKIDEFASALFLRETGVFLELGY